MTYDFEGVLIRIAEVLSAIPGRITVEGHTDDVPVRGGPFASNWDLSAARAATVTNALLASSDISPLRMRVSGYAATQPRNSNETAESRARNRRVEIIADLSESLAVVEADARARLQDIFSRPSEKAPPPASGSRNARNESQAAKAENILSW